MRVSMNTHTLCDGCTLHAKALLQKKKNDVCFQLPCVTLCVRLISLSVLDATELWAIPFQCECAHIVE